MRCSKVDVLPNAWHVQCDHGDSRLIVARHNAVDGDALRAAPVLPATYTVAGLCEMCLFELHHTSYQPGANMPVQFDV